MRHLSPQDLLDIAEGTRPAAAFAHLDSCRVCRGQLADLRETLSLAAEADVPEPSPLFWDHLTTRVHDAIAADRTAGSGWRHSAWRAALASWKVAAAAAAAAALVLAASSGLRAPAPDSSESVPTATSTVETPPDLLAFDDDPALAALADLTAELDWDAAAAAGLAPSHGAVDRVVLGLNEEERVALRQVLQEVLRGPGA